MPPFDPPDPVTLGYVGSSSGLVGIVLRLLVEFLPASWRPALKPWVLVAVMIGGLNGVVVWARALLGDLPQSGTLVPESTDLVSFVLGFAGFGTLAAIIAWLWERWVPPGDPDVDGDRWATIGGGIGLCLGVLLWCLLPDLHSANGD